MLDVKCLLTKNEITNLLNDITILKGCCNHTNQLWEVDLKTLQSPHPFTNYDTMLNNVFRVSSKPSISAYLHAACGYPMRSTWLKAIKKVFFFHSWPFLTYDLIQKHLQHLFVTSNDHLRQTPRNLQSTQHQALSFPLSLFGSITTNSQMDFISGFFNEYSYRIGISVLQYYH